VEVPISNSPNRTQELVWVNTSVWVAVASSRLVSGVISGMAATKLAVMLSEVNFRGEVSITGSCSGFDRPVSEKAIRAAMAAPPVMRMGAIEG
jgi:hypothetical protein